MMSKKKIKIESVSVDFGGIRELTLTTLQRAKGPIPIKDLTESIKRKFIGTNQQAVKSAMESLVIEGYDIKEIMHGRKKMYALVRFHERTEENMYRIHGEIKTPTLITADWHIGSKGFYKIAFNKLVKDVEEYSIEDVCIAGDLIQGRGVYSTELSELLIPSLGEQIAYASELLNEIECNVHLVLGNHEEKVQGSVHVGLDPLKLVAIACENVQYYGHVANMKLNDKFTYTMMHGSGAVTQATSHLVDKIWREIINKPNVLQIGHLHQINYCRKGHMKLGFLSGTLQRTNAWLLQKGYTSKIGWMILDEFVDNETVRIIDRMPRLN